ncbi:MAG: hypothetical protein ACRDZ6_03560 [Acidimicrobiales bacterium]
MRKAGVAPEERLPRYVRAILVLLLAATGCLATACSSGNGPSGHTTTTTTQPGY